MRYHFPRVYAKEMMEFITTKGPIEMSLLKKRKRKEASVEKPAVAFALERWGVTGVKMNLMGRRSWPDRMFVFPHPNIVFIEFKRPGEEPTDGQADVHKELRGYGYAVHVIDDLDEAKEILTQYAIQSGLERGPSRLGTTRLPKEGDEVRPRKSRRRAVPGSRSR